MSAAWKAPTWEETKARAESMGWTYGRTMYGKGWRKRVGSITHHNGGELWRREVDNPLWDH